MVDGIALQVLGCGLGHASEKFRAVFGWHPSKGPLKLQLAAALVFLGDGLAGGLG